MMAHPVSRWACSTFVLICIVGFGGVPTTNAESNAAEVTDVKINWQDGWRMSLSDCMEKKKAMFVNKKGKPITRRLSDMPTIVAENIEAEENKKKAEEERKKKKPPQKKPQTKKEKQKQALMGHLGGTFENALEAMPEPPDTKLEMLKTKSQEMFMQIIARSKLPPDTEINLREFCDLVWRAGNASPLDPDEWLNPPTKDEEDL
mmetsp:Transcript_17617/g.31846  ORF Transcript_17617/g.31846 Transcript_17617/m.31846 type:complete len:204 (-) Transcript_17617:107-718(-)